MPFHKLLSLLFLSTVLLFSRSTVGLNINAEDFEVKGSTDINTFSEYTNGTIFILDANFINVDNDDLFNTQSNTFFGLGLSAHNSFQGMEGLSLGLGARLVYLEDFIALPLMVEASYALPIADSSLTASLSTAILYAPSVLSFSDAENYFEFRAEAALEVISSVSVYAGYRDIEANYFDHSAETFNSSFYGGMKMSF